MKDLTSLNLSQLYDLADAYIESIEVCKMTGDYNLECMYREQLESVLKVALKEIESK